MEGSGKRDGRGRQVEARGGRAEKGGEREKGRKKMRNRRGELVGKGEAGKKRM